MRKMDADEKLSQADILLRQVLATFEATPDPRLRELMTAAVRHLHAFAREVNLSHDERSAGVLFLTAVGQMCAGVRQEFELLSDTLGLSSLVETSVSGPGATLQTLTGPFYSEGAPLREFGENFNEYPLLEDIPVVIRGVVTDLDGNPVPDATIDVWQNASNRQYAVQQPGVQPPNNLRGKWVTGPDGRYEFRTIKPVSYAIPDDGPVGAMLRATGRHPWRAAHIHLKITAAGHRPLITELFDRDSDYLDDDAVFGVAEALILDFTEDASGELAAVMNLVLEHDRTARAT
jgi:protocatechuate 3,4-dioxygenase beta subunit